MDPDPHLADLRRDFRLKAEAVFLYIHGLDNFPAETFVTGLHIGQFLVREEIGQHGQRAVGQLVGQVALGNSSEETGPVADPCLPRKDRLQHLRIILRIVFQICVLDDHDIPGRMGKSGPQGAALALVLLMIDNLADQRPDLFFQNFLRTSGILEKLEALEIEEGDTVRMYDLHFDYYK